MESNHEDLLKSADPKGKVTINMGQVSFITRYGAQQNHVRMILTKHWHVFTIFPILVQIVGPRPLMVDHRAHNLSDCPVHSKFRRTSSGNWLTDPPPALGIQACGCCQICKYVERTYTLVSVDGLKRFKIWHFIHCSATHLIFMLQCPCGKLYIGKTQWQLKIPIINQKRCRKLHSDNSLY